jgi:hypothetical protein
MIIQSTLVAAKSVRKLRLEWEEQRVAAKLAQIVFVTEYRYDAIGTTYGVRSGPCPSFFRSRLE